MTGEEDKRYDPADLSPHRGRTFATKNSYYTISSDGRILGRPSIEGAKVLHVAGVTLRGYVFLRHFLEDEKRFNELILEHGQRPEPGLHLVVSLTHKSVEEKDRVGLITSPLKPEGE